MKTYHALIKALLFLFFLLIGQVLQAAGRLEKISQTGILTIGYRDAASPFSFPNENQQPVGYSVDICQKITEAIKREVKRPDLTIKYVQVTAASRIPEIVAGNIDIECGSTTNTAERRKQVDFTIPTFLDNTKFMVHKDSGINNARDLRGKKVITTKGTIGADAIRSLQLVGSVLVEGANHAESFAALEVGQVDAFLNDAVQLTSLRGASKVPTDFLLLNDILGIGQLAIMLPKDDQKFKKIVDIEVSRVIISGEINLIYKKWFESPIPPKQVNLNLPMSHLLRDSFKVPSDWVPN